MDSNCAQCHGIPAAQPLVEWLTDANGVCLANTIRIVCANCTYYDTQQPLLDRNGYWDRAFELSTLKKYINIVNNMAWDNYPLAMQRINEVLKHAN